MPISVDLNNSNFSNVFDWTAIMEFIYFPKWFLNFLKYFGIDISVSNNHKSRFFESVIFATMILFVILIASTT